jgi:uncharacterized protein YjbI with pentapeptide repeats
VAPAFSRSSEFAIDKPAGVPCPHLAADHQCSIHDRLRPSGFSGCTAYDCFGAGQRLAQETFGGRDWRAEPVVEAPMMAALPTMRALHELLWYVREALDLPTSGPVHGELTSVADRVETAAGSSPADLRTVDLGALRSAVVPVLREASRLARAELDGADYAGEDLSGADLRGADLRGASFRGGMLIGARLDHADLAHVDLLGTDLRGAVLRGARLAQALFVTHTQLGGAHGDRRTTLPADLSAPAHWTA